MIFAHQIYVIFTICLPYNALATLIPSSNLTILTTDDNFDCIPRSSIFSKAPTLEDCQAAISLLPHTDNFGSFHNGPPDDLYMLPVEKDFGTCIVNVEMLHQGSSKEALSWLHIVATTYQLSKHCIRSRLWPNPGAGAVIQLGEHNRIVVIVKYYRPRED